MRVLIISHTVFSNNESMGKTLTSYFSEFDSNDLAQFYIHSQVPNSKICKRYFRMTDKDAIMSIFGLRKGTEFGLKEINEDRNNTRVDKGLTASIYKTGRKRTPMIYLARNMWWYLSHWNNKRLNKWISEFNPDCVFFASGDYSFMYRIALKISKNYNIPLYISCMDDYYFNNRNNDSILGRFQHNRFMKIVKKTINYSKAMFCICDKMTADYNKYFMKKCYTLHTPATIDDRLNMKKIDKISYLGSLGYNRADQLVDIGKMLKNLNLKPNHIDVYSSENRKEVLSKLSVENGIIFHGSVNAEEVLKVMGESTAVIHVESFDKRIRNSIKYSVSTKIADSLASGTCILAYGPDDVASIMYLKDNDAAVVCSDYNDLSNKLLLIMDNKKRKDIEEKAVNLAKQNHSKKSASEIIISVIDNKKE